MELNKIIFPAPSCSYNSFTFQRMIWIPRSRFFSLKRIMKPLGSSTFSETYYETRTFAEGENVQQSKQVHIPCLYVPYHEGSDKILLYFHGNAEDVGYAYDFARRLGHGLKVNVLSVEYPGYGVYEGDPNAKTILEDSEIVYDFLTQEVGVLPENIFLFGRSIGSGPTTYLAANREPGLLILMSPYTSIRDVVKSVAGKWAQYLVAERFRNIDEISKVDCPCFFIHGKKDKLIPDTHTRELFANCKAVAGMNLSETMTHNDFSLTLDLLKPVQKFLRQIGVSHVPARYTFPDYVTSVPLRKYKKRSATVNPRSAPTRSNSVSVSITKARSL